jgi:hypothetical protein
VTHPRKNPPDPARFPATLSAESPSIPTARPAATFEETADFFCSLACAAEFARHPERFARDRARAAGGRSRRA